MSNEEDYTHNIDDQLLRAVKQEVNVNQQHNNNYNINQSLPYQYQQNNNLNNQNLNINNQNNLNHLSNNFDENEYNIQIPEPIINSKSKIYPVEENTITAEGNLITRPYPEQTFHDRKDLNDFIAEFARDNGFGVVIAHSNKKAIYYTCELGGKYRDKKNKKKLEDNGNNGTNDDYLLDPNTKTKKLKCPFAMTASFRKNNQTWLLKTTCNEHNHPQLDPLSNHPMLRKRSTELNLLIVDLYKVGTKPSHIESKIREQYPDILIKREDIYNEIRGYKRKLKRENGFINQNNDDRFRKRNNASSLHQVGLDDDDDINSNYEEAERIIHQHQNQQNQQHHHLQQQHNHNQHHNQHHQSQHNHNHQQQLQHNLPQSLPHLQQIPHLNNQLPIINPINNLPQQPQMGMNMGLNVQNNNLMSINDYNGDGELSNDQITMDNIDSRLVGE
ncbi:hypothetical protein CLIB1444_10S02564 [[Candida] jaroonii]|uniref:Uncharacterized protein n=1 Tax=[Candida] jaroonii TaxID=467808 RepID=A0ACA9YCH8_9ASCO|nr:hypothetical protein CLIB1444_10S02564 [[Candida] jaroonii]